MKLFLKLAAAILVNMLAVYLAAYYVRDFTVSGGWTAYLEIAAALTLLNLILKPILKLIFAPIILLTLGFGLILVNAIVLKVLTLFPLTITISGTLAYVLGAIIISFVNFVFHFATKA